MEMTKKWHPLYLGFGAAFVSLVVYILTAPRSFFPYDPIEFVTALHTLSIPHAPGYPLYILLGKLISLVLPLGGGAFEANIISSLYATATVFLTYFIVYRATREPYAALFSALMLAWSQLFWFYAIVADVFALHLLIVFGCIALLQQWFRTKNPVLLLWGALLFGAGFGNHHMLILLLPGFLYLLSLELGWKRTVRISPRLALIAFVSIILLYALVLIRSYMNPVIDWDNPETLSNLWRLFTRADFGSLRLSNFYETDSYSLSRIFLYGWWYLKSFVWQFFPWGLLLIAGGLTALYKQKREWFIAALLCVFFPALFFIVMTSNTVIDHKLFITIVEKFYIMPHALSILLAGYGFALLLRATRGTLWFGMLAILACSVPFISLYINWDYNNLRTYNAFELFVTDILHSTEQNALIVTTNDALYWGTLYFQQIKHEYTDKTVLWTGEPDITVKKIAQAVGTALNTSKPVYVLRGQTFLIAPLEKMFVPLGLVEKIALTQQERVQIENKRKATIEAYELPKHLLVPQRSFDNTLLSFYTLLTQEVTSSPTQ